LADATVCNPTIVAVPAVGRVIDLIEDQEALPRPQVRRIAQGDDRGAFRITGGPVRGVLHAPRPAEAPFEADDGVWRGTAVTRRRAGEDQLRPVGPGAAEGDVALHVQTRGEGEGPCGEDDDLIRGTRCTRGADLRGGASRVERRANGIPAWYATGSACVAPVDSPRGFQHLGRSTPGAAGRPFP